MQRFFACAIGLAAGTYLGFLYSEMDEPALISKVEVETKRVSAGDDLRLKLHMFRLRNDCSYSETRTFHAADGSQRGYTVEIQRQGQPLGASVEERHIRVPLGVPPGPAELVSTAAFSCGANWLQRWWPTTVTVRHVYFNVTAPPD